MTLHDRIRDAQIRAAEAAVVQSLQEKELAPAAPKVGLDQSSKATFPSAKYIAYAGAVLAEECNRAAATWWIDPETGEDVRNWPPKFFKLWVGSKLMLCVTELAEAMEGHRKGSADDHLPHRKMFDVELGDAVIRIFDLAGGLGIPLGEIIVEKLAYNAQRADHKLNNRAAAGGKSI